MWVVGFLMSLAASISGALGKLFLKLRHDQIKRDGPKSCSAKISLAAGIFGLTVNPVLDILSYGYAPQVRITLCYEGPFLCALLFPLRRTLLFVFTHVQSKC